MLYCLKVNEKTCIISLQLYLHCTWSSLKGAYGSSGRELNLRWFKLSRFQYSLNVNYFFSNVHLALNPRFLLLSFSKINSLCRWTEYLLKSYLTKLRLYSYISTLIKLWLKLTKLNSFTSWRWFLLNRIRRLTLCPRFMVCNNWQ